MAKKNELSEQFKTLVGLAKQLAKHYEAAALLVWVEDTVPWEALQQGIGEIEVVVASDQASHLEGAVDAGLHVVHVDAFDAPVNQRLSTALLEAIAADILPTNADVVAIFSAFKRGKVDTVSYIQLDEHLGRFSVRDLQQLETTVPMETLKPVLDIAMQIGREGREGKDVGTMFLVGDVKKVLKSCSAGGFDPVFGYSPKDKNIRDKRTRDAVKEVCVLDGAFVISSEGVVVAACQIIDASGADIALSSGFGARHHAAAAITKKTSTVAVTVSESGGTVRIFQDGNIMKTIEPFRRAMVWKSDHRDDSIERDEE